MLRGVQSSQQIAETLRADICLNRAIDDGILHEGALAQRFGVSRTPIRQALQRLAYERMITVKSGVGSVITPLYAAQRDDDIRAALAVIEAVARCAPSHAAETQQVMEFAGMLGMLEISDPNRPEAFFEVRARMLMGLASLIENPILCDAFRAAYWRLIRWRLDDLQNDRTSQVTLLRNLVKDTVGTLQKNTIAATFTRVAEVEGACA